MTESHPPNLAGVSVVGGCATFQFKREMHGLKLIACLSKNFGPCSYEDRTVDAQIGGVLWTLHEPILPSNLVFISRVGESHLINDRELYSGIVIPEEYIECFVIPPNEW